MDPSANLPMQETIQITLKKPEKRSRNLGMEITDNWTNKFAEPKSHPIQMLLIQTKYRDQHGLLHTWNNNQNLKKRKLRKPTSYPLNDLCWHM